MSQSFVLFGNESILAQCGERILNAGNSISAVVTRSDDLKKWSKQHKISTFSPSDDLDHLLGSQEFDWLLSLAYLSIIPDNILEMAKKGAINFHDGLLPEYAGLNTPVWARLNQEKEHGITWHFMESGIDKGDILERHRFEIQQNDTAFSLNAKCFETAIESFDSVLDKLTSGEYSRQPQSFEARKYFSRFDRPNGFGIIDPNQSSDAILALVNALDHQGYWNPLTTPKIVVDGSAFAVSGVEITQESGDPGEILGFDADTLTVATKDSAVRLTGLKNTDGNPLNPEQISNIRSVKHVESVGLEAENPLSQSCAKSEAFWRKALVDMPGTQLGLASPSGGTSERKSIKLNGLEHSDLTMGAIFAWACVQQEEKAATLALGVDAKEMSATRNIVSPWKPVSISLENETVEELTSKVALLLSATKKKHAFATDLLDRAPELSGVAKPSIGLSETGEPVSGCDQSVCLEDSTLHYDIGSMSDEAAAILADRLDHFVKQFKNASSSEPVRSLPSIPDRERELMLTTWNQTSKAYDANVLLHHPFEASVKAHPDATALVFEDQIFTYADLNNQADTVASRLNAVGVGNGDIVGLFVHRSPDLVIAALGILKAGAAYLALDPSYPEDRTEYCLRDSDAKAVVAHSAVVSKLPSSESAVIVIDRPEQDPEGASTRSAQSAPDDLAYMIYTSGSTGKPKGVMVEHRNVANFFAGMDERIPHEPAGTWLAVTSLSFDISVLEIFWTLGRGFKLVMTGDEGRTALSNGPLPSQVEGMDFSLYYWGNDDGSGRDKYKSLLEGAKFADQHGFTAVWTPERHFHAFGGPYPNPSVTGAAVAAVSRNLSVRAGSCVAPLHHTARIAEEWSVIDNLTNGRAGLAIASGWQPDDFVLRPENTPPNNREAMFDSINDLRKLWAGEPVGFPKADGTMHEVVTQPRPVSKKIPIWVTTAGNPETWRQAGEIGANVLTHLLGQSVAEVGDKIKLYHEALRENGHDPKDFNVTLMLHTYLAEDREKAREIAREPMKDYLRSAAGLIKQYAWAFPAFKRPKGVDNAFQLDLGVLNEEELDAILDFAFLRYFEESGLFGTVQDAMKRVEEVKKIGVTEIACLIDYGIDADTVLEGLHPVAEVVKRCNEGAKLDAGDFSVAAQMVRHKVSHMQCTPSMAQMFIANDETRQAMGGLKHILLGGEALPGALVKEINTVSNASIENMYGPTETTIWSSTATANAVNGTVPIGTPIANTKLYILDDNQQLVPVGTPGELWIGGDGVARGYWKREELTAERFIKDPFSEDPNARMYRTGDLVSLGANGSIDYIGRTDFQVKVRGFRIELGEIEAAMDSHSDISQSAVVVVQESAGDQRIVGYFTSNGNAPESHIRGYLADRLPSHMVPSSLIKLDDMPLTPNKKIDRNALLALGGKVAKPAQSSSSTVKSQSLAEDSVESQISAIWQSVLGDVEISSSDNFFDIGGHSLLAVQSHRVIREKLAVPKLSITDIFRFPVLKDLSNRVAELSGSKPEKTITRPAEETTASQKSDLRASAIERRRAMRLRRRS